MALIDLTRLSQAVSEIKEHCLNTFALIVHSHSPASPSTSGSGGYAGFMSASDKEKLDGIEAGANAYTLPAATSSTIGGVKPDGTTVTVDADGTIHGANSYTLPTMGANTKGGAKLGAGLAVADDTLSLSGESYTSAEKSKLAGIASGANNYTLPIASTSTLGGVKPDGTSITIDSDGTIHGPGSGGGTVFGVKGDAETDYRTGNVNLTPANIGAAEATHYHTALGNSSTTVLSVDTSLYSVAEGLDTTASGGRSHAEGTDTVASGNFSHAEGHYTTASGNSSHAEGMLSKASANMSHAEGSNSVASNYYALAEGENTIASGLGAHAEGKDTKAEGAYSHAEGNYSRAAGSYAHAEGASTYAVNTGTHAQGVGTIAASAWQVALGQYNVDESSDTYAVIIGNGTADNDRSNALAVRWDGLVDVAGANTAYPMFIWSTTPTNSSTFPVSPCFVYCTADNGLYYCTN